MGFLITYWGPIGVILTLSLFKELWDHYKIIKKDSTVNKESFTKLTMSGPIPVCSKDIRAGDFIKLAKNQRIPVLFTFPMYHSKIPTF